MSWCKTITKSWWGNSNHWVSFQLSLFCAEKLPYSSNLITQDILHSLGQGT